MRFAQAQGPQWGRAIQGGNKRQLQVAAIGWQEGVETLRSLNPPKDATGPHRRLVAATQGLAKWNTRLVAAAPDKKRVAAVARQAQNSPTRVDLPQPRKAISNRRWSSASCRACSQRAMRRCGAGVGWPWKPFQIQANSRKSGFSSRLAIPVLLRVGWVVGEAAAGFGEDRADGVDLRRIAGRGGVVPA